MNNSIPKDKYFVVKCKTPLAGNQVKIQLEGDNRLVLCDVKINGGKPNSTLFVESSVLIRNCRWGKFMFGRKVN